MTRLRRFFSCRALRYVELFPCSKDDVVLAIHRLQSNMAAGAGMRPPNHGQMAPQQMQMQMQMH